MTLEEQLVASAPRDRSGSLAADRFDYQKNWALCELLILHASGKDYVMTFDHHEDVSVLNAANAPTEYRAYQVKTKTDGNWTSAALTKRLDGEGGKSLPSILGKLCSAISQFNGSVKLLQFVSNAPYRVQLAATGTADLNAKLISFDQIAKPKRQAILTALKSESPNISEKDLSNLLQLKVADLHLADHVNHTKGKLLSAIEDLFPRQNFPITPIYRAIIGEIAARNNNQEKITSYEEYLRKKSLSRSRFSEILNECGVSKNAVDWLTVEARLNAENAPLALVLALKREWPTVQIDRLQKKEDVQFVAMLAAIREVVQQVRSLASLREMVDGAFALLKRKAAWPYTEEYIRTCIVVYIYEA